MPARSSLNALPDALRDELNRKLVAAGFSGYAEMSDWLAEQGFEISRSAVHRYGQAFEARMGKLRMASEQAKAIVAEMGDDAGEMGEALTAVAQQKTFELLMDLDVDPKSVEFDKLVTATAKLNATGVAQKKWRSEARAKAQAAAQAVEERVIKKGLGAADVAFIKKEILGVVS